MGATFDETRVELEAQRARVRATADRLDAATRRAFDLPARIRERPIQTAAIAGGLAFLLLGGPRRVIRQVRQVVRGSDGDRAYAALPGSLRALIDSTAPGRGDARDEARRQLALALHAWREDPKNRRRAARLAGEALAPPGPSRAFWSVVEVAGATAVGLLARRAVTRWLTGDPLRDAPWASGDRPDPTREAAPGGSSPQKAASGGATTPGAATLGATTPGATSTGRYAGWSGQRSDVAGPAKKSETPAKRPS